MGQTLSEPVVDKHSDQGEDARLAYGVSEMQGWRLSESVVSRSQSNTYDRVATLRGAARAMTSRGNDQLRLDGAMHEQS